MVDFSSFSESDGAPMAESVENMVTMIEMIFGMNYLMEIQGRTHFAVGGNQFLFYNERNGNDTGTLWVSPDVYVPLDVPPGLRATWKTWLEGKCPDLVREITSTSTQDEDTGTKLRRYGELGAREYYIYDPLHTLNHPLRAYRYEAGRPVARGRVGSPLLGAELRVVGTYLRVVDPRTGEPMVAYRWLSAASVVDPRTGEPMLMTEEERRARIAAETRAEEEEGARRTATAKAGAAEATASKEAAARQAAESRAQAATDGQRAAEATASEEATARQAAESRAQEAEDVARQTALALQEVLAQLARLSAGE